MNCTHYEKNKSCNLFYLKQGILFFWACWFLIAFSTNLIDLLNAFHVTNEWKFHSGNYRTLENVINIYHAPSFILNLFFCSDIFIQGIAALLFFAASLRFWKSYDALPCINFAFGISMALWAMFLIMEEIFLAYSYEATHIRLLLLEMLSLFAFYLLPSYSRN